MSKITPSVILFACYSTCIIVFDFIYENLYKLRFLLCSILVLLPILILIMITFKFFKKQNPDNNDKSNRNNIKLYGFKLKKHTILTISLSWLIGVSWLFIFHEYLISQPVSRYKYKRVAAQVITYPSKKDNKGFFTVKVIGIQYNYQANFTRTNFLLMAEMAPFADNLKIGDTLIIQKPIRYPFSSGKDNQYQRYLKSVGISGKIKIKSGDWQIYKGKKTFQAQLMNAIWSIKNSIHKTISRKLKKSNASFLMAILLSEKKELDENIYTDFYDSGLMHLLAISGLHIGIIAGFFFLIFKSFLPKSMALIISSCFLYAYQTLLTNSPSINRAIIMYTLYVLTVILSKKRDPYNILALAAIIILLQNPYQLFHIGFQFSFLATFSIFYLTPGFQTLLKKMRIPGFLNISLSISLATFIMLLPLQWYYFQCTTPVSILNNLIAVPVFSILICLFFCYLVCLKLITAVTLLSFTHNLIDRIIDMFLFLINKLAWIKPVSLPEIPFILVIIMYTAIFLLFNRKSRRCNNNSNLT